MNARASHLLAALLALLAAGCSAQGGSSEPEKPVSGGAATSESVLVVDGEHVDLDAGGPAPRTAGTAAAKAKKPAKRRSHAASHTPWPAPSLLGDGSIDDGPDPFLGAAVQVLPVPIEDDARTTASIDQWSERLRRVEREQWDEWMASESRSPWGQTDDPAFNSLVKVTIERCGGSQAVASGVVLADETVVTTAHAVENIARRIRIAPALGDAPRLPAMLRYLDVDDDIAVLKVPGLTLKPLAYYTATGSEPKWGYAYAVSRGGRAGSVRRVAAIVAAQESRIDLEQPDGFAERISDRSVLPMVAGIDTGASGGIVTATNDPKLVRGFGFHGIVRARVPYRANTAGIVVPARLVRAAVAASSALDPWFEHRPGGCPQWHR